MTWTTQVFRVLAGVIALSAMPLVAAAQESARLSVVELEADLKNRMQLSAVRLDVVATAEGYSGSFSLRGNLNPGASRLRAGVAAGAPEDLAKEALASLPELMSAQQFGEMRVEGIESMTRNTMVHLQLYVAGIPVEGVSANVRIEDGIVVGVMGVVAPVGEAASSAAAQKVISESDVRATVLQALIAKSPGEAPSGIGALLAKKKIIAEPPYVIYDVSGGMWEYRVDARSGEVLRVLQAWQSLN